MRRGAARLVDLRSWAWFLRYHERPLALVLVAAATSLVSSGALLGVALLVRRGLETTIPSGSTPELLECAGAILGLLALEALVRAGAMRWTFGSLKRAIQRLRGDLLRRLYALPRSVTTGLEVGKVHGVLVHGTAALDGLSFALLGQLLPGAIVSAGLAVVLLVLDVRLALVMLGLVPVLALLARVVGGRLRARTRDVARAAVELSNSTLFALEALDLVRARAAEEQELARQERTLDLVRRTTHEATWLHNVYRLLQERAAALFVIATVLVGGLAVRDRRISLEEIVVVYVVLTLMRSHLAEVWAAIPTIVEGLQALEDVHGVFRLEGSAPYSGTRAVTLAGRVRLEDVAFGYGDAPLFSGLSLETAPGKITAVVGRNGAGKTTLGHLVLGLYRPAGGRLLAEGVPYDELDLAALRRSIGLVPQEPFLFAGTVRENVVYGAPAATGTAVARAASLATLDAALEGMPRGLETPVGEGGRLLSGGQRQRIALARALLGDPGLLILDEPTHNLDRATTAALLQNLRRSPAAILVFTHDAAVVAGADEVLRLADGRLERVARDPGASPAAALP